MLRWIISIIAAIFGGLFFLGSAEEKRQKQEAAKKKELEAAKQKELEAARQKEFEIARQKELEAVRQKQIEVAKQKELEERLKFLTEFELDWGKKLSGFILIDSNIWMEYDYQNFFDVLMKLLEKTSNSIVMPSEQFDEIVNLKNRPYEDRKSKQARCALSRIESFQNKRKLKIIPMGVKTEKEAYADPVILKILINKAAECSNVTLISCDRELRIRANGLVSEDSCTFFAIDGLQTVDDFEKYKKFS